MFADSSRRGFFLTFAGLVLLPRPLFAFSPETQDRDVTKILAELPHANLHIDRLSAACQKYAHIYPIPLTLAAKVQAIESGFDCDAISRSFAVGGAQFMHATARELGANLPSADSFKPQDEALASRGKANKKWNDAVTAFKRGEDTAAARLRSEAKAQTSAADKQYEKIMAEFRKEMFAVNQMSRRALDERFDPAVGDDMLVHYLAKLARGIKKDLGVEDDAHIQLLAGVAYNAGPGNVKRKPGIPVVAQNVEYANKLMLFQQLKL